MKLLRLDLVVHDERAADLLEAMREHFEYCGEDPNVPGFVFVDYEIRGVPSKHMAKLTTDERESLN